MVSWLLTNFSISQSVVVKQAFILRNFATELPGCKDWLTVLDKAVILHYQLKPLMSISTADVRTANS